jgi:hypothetical protein
MHLFTRIILIAIAVTVCPGCSSGDGRAICVNAGDNCSVNGGAGVCKDNSPDGCVPVCTDLFDSTSCSIRPKSACYPVYRNKFGCVDIDQAPSGVGGSCISSGDCKQEMACVSRRCMAGCDASHPCPDGGGSCVDERGYGWKVCKVTEPRSCIDIGDYCDFNGESGVCDESGDFGCRRLCTGFFDTASCLGLSGTACYPAYKEKFACLPVKYPTKGSCEPCSVHNECAPTMACLAGFCRYGCNEANPCSGRCEGICFDYAGYGWTICGYFQPDPCMNVGDACIISRHVGVCIETGNDGCSISCTGFFDTTFCRDEPGTACYPVFKEKFACLEEGVGSAGETCSKPSDCKSGLACIENKCLQGCDDSNKCPPDGGACTDLSGSGWKVCRK